MTDTGNDDRLLTAGEAARYLGYAEGTVRNKAADGDLPSVKLPSGGLRFRRSELEAWSRGEWKPEPEPVANAGEG
jgi:excisionase family DNA binding protein